MMFQILCRKLKSDKFRASPAIYSQTLNYSQLQNELRTKTYKEWIIHLLSVFSLSKNKVERALLITTEWYAST